MKTILILLISLITLNTQAQDQETKPSKKETTQTLTVSIPMMGMISIQNCSTETAKAMEPVQLKSKKDPQHRDEAMIAEVNVKRSK